MRGRCAHALSNREICLPYLMNQAFCDWFTGQLATWIDPDTPRTPEEGALCIATGPGVPVVVESPCLPTHGFPRCQLTYLPFDRRGLHPTERLLELSATLGLCARKKAPPPGVDMRDDEAQWIRPE